MYFGIIFIPTHQLQTLTSFLWSSHLKCLNFWTSWPIATKTNTPESRARYDTMPVSRTAYRRRIYRKCFDRDSVLIIAFLFHVRSLTSFLWSFHLKCLNFCTSWPIATKTNTPESWARYDTMPVNEKTWWKDLYQQSGFTNKWNFLRQVLLEVDHKAGPLYVKVKKRRSPVPANDTFMKWLNSVVAANIASNFRSKKKIASMIMNFINKEESYLSKYGLGITWAIIQVKAKHFGKKLNDLG